MKERQALEAANNPVDVIEIFFNRLII